MNSLALELRAKRLAALNAYASRIRNPAKKAYAWACVEAFRKGDDWPTAPASLSYMGGQAVRLSIRKIADAVLLVPAHDHADSQNRCLDDDGRCVYESR